MRSDSNTIIHIIGAIIALHLLLVFIGLSSELTKKKKDE